MSGGTYKNWCLRKCTPRLGCNECDPATGFHCKTTSGASVSLWRDAVCLFKGCAKDADCPVSTSQLCQTTLNNCPAGEKCWAIVSGSTDGKCYRDGACDTKSGLCKGHTLGKAAAKVGDPCKSDLDCGGNMECEAEFDESKYWKQPGQPCTTGSECCSNTCTANKCAGQECRVRRRNGYCVIKGCIFGKSLPHRACPAGALCSYRYQEGYCLKTCNLSQASQCRGHVGDLLGDYDCYNWNNVNINYGKVTTGPVCDFSYTIPCSLFTGVTTMGCFSLGITGTQAGNTTNMACRNRYNIILGNKVDPKGMCLDITPSGPALPLPDGGLPDAGVYLDATAKVPFGGKCTSHAQCASNKCISVKSGSPTGFCTKTCKPGVSGECSGAPTGTFASCQLTSGSTSYCAFICKMFTNTWPCPYTLTCDSTAFPPGLFYLCY